MFVFIQKQEKKSYNKFKLRPYGGITPFYNLVNGMNFILSIRNCFTELKITITGYKVAKTILLQTYLLF